MDRKIVNRRQALVSGALGIGVALGAALGTAGIAAASGSPQGPTGASTGNTGTASTSTKHQLDFANAKAALLKALALRAPQLTRLAGDATSNQSVLQAFTSLSGGQNDFETLSSRISTESANIASLTTAVNSATTPAQLQAARKSMLVDNRVFAVMTPQVFLAIEADTLATQVKSLQNEEPTLQAAVDSIAGQPGAVGAANRYRAFVNLVTEAYAHSTGVAAHVLGTEPQGWPGNQHVFEDANHALLSVGENVARANYSATLISLATASAS